MKGESLGYIDFRVLVTMLFAEVHVADTPTFSTLPLRQVDFDPYSLIKKPSNPIASVEQYVPPFEGKRVL